MGEHKSSEERREEIVSAMVATMAEHGYAKATIAKVAERAGLTAGLLHYHFKNKQQILLAVLDDLADRQLESMGAVIAGSGTPSEAVDAVVRLMLSPGDSSRPQDVATWVSILAEAVRQPEVAKRLAEHQEAFRSQLASLLERGEELEQYDLDGIGADAVAAGLLALIQGYFALGVTTRSVIPKGSAHNVAMRFLEGFRR